MSYNVQNLTNDNFRSVANQYVIRTKRAVYFQSYNSVVAKITNGGKLHLSTYWNYSQTTIRNLYIFLREYGYSDFCSTKAMEKAIDNNDVKLHKESSLPLC